MAALSAADFFKEASKSRPDRKQIVLKKYKNKEPFAMKDGKVIVFKYEKKIYDQIAGLVPGDSKGYNAIIFTGSDNKKYKLNTIAKSKEFGGGGGSGAGAENTKLNESSVCLWCAIYKTYKKADLKTVVTNYKKVKKLYVVDEEDNNMISQTDDLWLKHYERCAEFLIKNYFKTGKYVFHRGSDFVNAINAKFSELNKQMEIPFANINKWSPADIWVVKEGFELPYAKIKTLDEFNRVLLNELKKKNIYGISLKKTLNTAHKTNFNMGEKRPPMLFNGYRIVAPKGNIMSSKDVYVYAKGEDDISMQIRSFDDLSGYQGELIGTVAKYGKIAHGPMNMVLKDLKLEAIPNQQDVIRRAKAKDKKLIKELYQTFEKYGEPGMSESQFVTTALSSATKADYIYSKYLGVKIIDILMKTTKQKRNDFVQGAVGYALSNTKHSAPFIKIS